MPFTKSNTNYNNIEKYIKGITLISRGSINLLKTAYAGNLENTSKLLASYTWTTTRDTTMVLITCAILVLAEKNKDRLKNELTILEKNEVVYGLLADMAKGNGNGAETKITKGQLFKNLFIAVLKSGNIPDKKAEKIWEGYKKQVSKIKPWKFSVDTLINCINPILEYSLTEQYYKTFETYLPLLEAQTKVDYEHVISRIIENTKRKNYCATNSVTPKI